MYIYNIVLLFLTYLIFTEYYSKVIPQTALQELASGLEDPMVECIVTWAKYFDVQCQISLLL